MGSRGQSKQKKYASEDRRQREDAKREGARRGAKYYEYTDRKGNTTTGETGNERARGGTYRAKFDEDVVRYANMSPEELERERDRQKNESNTANWGITRAAASRTASAVDQAAAADTQIARINQVLRRQSAAVKRAQERAEKRQATREKQAKNARMTARGWIKNQVNVDIEKYRDSATKQFDRRGYITVDWKNMPRTERAYIEQLAQKYPNRIQLFDAGSWAKQIRFKR